MESFDAIIVGGGLAGAMTGLLLKKKGWSVLILEKSQYPKHKVCGEFLSPAAWTFLEQAGVSEALRAQAGKEIKTLSLFWPGRKPLHTLLPAIVPSYPYAYGISRKTLDHFLLLEAQKQGCIVYQNEEVLTIKKDSQVHSFIIQTRNGRESKTQYQAPVVVNTAGKSHRLQSGNHTQRQRTFGFKAHFKNIPLDQATELFFFEGGYFGMLEIEKGFTNVCGKVEGGKLKHLGGQFDLLLKEAGHENQALATRLEKADRVTKWFSCGPLKEGFKKAYDDGIFYAGDAACFVEPFLGQGMTMAIASALLLAAHLEKGPADCGELERIGNRYQKDLRKLYQSKLKMGRFFKPFAFSPLLGSFLVKFFALFPETLDQMIKKSCSLSGVGHNQAG